MKYTIDYAKAMAADEKPAPKTKMQIVEKDGEFCVKSPMNDKTMHCFPTKPEAQKFLTKMQPMMSTWDAFLTEYPACGGLDFFDILTEIAVIVKKGSQWCVMSESGGSLGCYGSRKEAQDRLAQVEMFKHMKSTKAGQEFSRQQCECDQCGAIYWTPDMCQDAYCPICHAGPGENEELTGVL
jgi:hypothetical protein